MRRSLVGLGLFIVAACGTARHDDAASSIGSSREALVSYDSDGDEDQVQYKGDDLKDHELALTFDDGPGEDITVPLAQWLHDHKDPKGNPQPIHATFFVLGGCIKKTPLSNTPKNQGCDQPTDNATAILDKVVSLGHYIGNHTTTHRTLTEIAAADVPKELSETDGLITKYLVWNRTFFRAPTGGWNDDVFQELKGTAMNKYVGPIYWNIGGGPIDANQAADWACWNGPNGDGNGTLYSTKQCGDRYIKEIRAKKNRGIILMHDPYGDPTIDPNNAADLNKKPGNSFAMLRYILATIEKDATPWVFKRLDEVPQIAAKLPKCDASCVECSGPEADKCTSCAADKHLDGGKCVDGAPAGDGGTTDDAGTSSGDPTNTSSTSSSSGGGKSSSGSSNPSGDDAGAGDAAAPADDGGGCNTSGSDFGTSLGAAAIALGLVISRRSKRRRA